MTVIEKRHRGSRSRFSLRILDTSIVVVILGFLIAVFSSILHLHRFSSIAQTTISELHAIKASFVAIPEAMRMEVGRFIENGITPTLYDPLTASPQFFSKHKIDHVLLSKNVRDERISDISTTTFANYEPGTEYRLIDILQRSAYLLPLRAGQTIALKYSRPYIYLPLRASYTLEPGKPHQVSFYLDDGRYRLVVEAFQPKVTDFIRVVVSDHYSENVNSTKKLPPVSWEPFIYEFTLATKDSPLSGSEEITLTLSLVDENGVENAINSAFIHRIELEKL